MNGCLLRLVQELGLEPVRTSSLRGGEYHSPCPACGGKDRFMFWPAEGRYWCRRCGVMGDAIQFSRDFLGLSFRDASMRAKGSVVRRAYLSKSKPLSTLPWSPSCSWKSRAVSFVENAAQRLVIDDRAIGALASRGLSTDSIKKFQLGWNPVKAFARRADWGLEETEDQRWICLPAGIVIPAYGDDGIVRIKIRKSEWQEGDPYGKYYEVPGSSQEIPVFGRKDLLVVVVVESEFDAILIVQEAGSLCSCIALGGAQKRPGPSLCEWLLARRCVLFALDFDEAGKNEYVWWESHFINLHPWPVPGEKSPGDYFTSGGNLGSWVKAGIAGERKETRSA